ncbi:MAG: RDD family protein, partial [Pseudomonadota bacterium]
MHSPEHRDAGFNEPEGPPYSIEHPELFEEVARRRIAAYVIDLLVLGLVWLALSLALGLLTILSFGLLAPANLFILAALPLIYNTGFVGFRGATPGMRIMDIEVVTLTGDRPDYLQAFILIAVFYLSVSLTAWFILLIA